ncbi:phage portal protein [Clostridium cylindrosporum]|uniref:phage portal protein n=1 Tax=Clostridium cylindrosporum TaxID=1495 RepID=UPI00069F159E|nr:phage portal protein [Clostridium cylindrosporum]
MGLKDIWNKLRRGVRAGVIAMKENKINNEYLISTINAHRSSQKVDLMLKGDRYYKVENDIKSRRLFKVVNGKRVEETYKANNRIAHAKYKNLVDEKINYLLARDYSLKCNNTDYINKIKSILGKHFHYNLSELGYEASNKGIAWLHFYLEDNKFKTIVIPSEQCIPIWEDKTHTELKALIRVYDEEVWEYSKAKIIIHVEYWTPEDVTYYILDNNYLVYDYNNNNYENTKVSHFNKDNEWYAWGKVPFIPFKNNHIEMPDIKFVKTLLDSYDLSRSEAANYVEEVKNLIFVLKGYGGEDIDDFMRKLNEYRAVLVDDPQEGGVDTLTPTMDITALKEHYEQLKRDIIEDGQSVNKDLDKFGSAPSGVALKFMYSGLDLKCNALETQFKMGFEMLLYFINIYLSEIGEGTYENIDVDIIFNRDIEINESETIDNCQKSKGVISDKTILANHPWVKDIELEKKELESQKQESLPFKDKVPLAEVGEVDE